LRRGYPHAKGATVALQMNLSLDGLAFLTRPFFCAVARHTLGCGSPREPMGSPPVRYFEVPATFCPPENANALERCGEQVVSLCRRHVEIGLICSTEEGIDRGLGGSSGRHVACSSGGPLIGCPGCVTRHRPRLFVPAVTSACSPLA
jgi:hypothetical protein